MKLLLIIICWSWILLGLWWFFRPAGIKKRFETKFHKTARWLLLVILVVVAGVAFSVGRNIGGWKGILLIVVACIAALKGLLFLRGKASDKVLGYWSQQPTWVYRLAAAALVLLGCLMQWILNFGSTSS